MMRFIACVIALIGSAQPLAASHPLVPAFERFHRAPGIADTNLIDAGELLLGELNCTACHTADAARAARLITKAAPDLSAVGSRFARRPDLVRFITDPHAVKPGATMPRISGVEAEQIATFLMTLRSEAPPSAAGDLEFGRELFHQVGCIACHEPEAGWRPPSLAENVKLEPPASASSPIALAGLYGRDALVAFLSDPLTVRPGGRMPAMKLSQQEAEHITTYLHERLGRPQDEKAADAPAAADIETGRRQFISAGCAACHRLPGLEHSSTAPPLAALNPGAPTGCLSAKPRFDYQLDEIQRRAITAALQQRDAKPLSPAAHAHRTMLALNCYGCHERGGLGGPEAGRVVFFESTTELDLGLEGDIPPPLTYAGFKLQTGAIADILAGAPKSDVRPYMATRMPIFGEANVVHLPPLLEQSDMPVVPLPPLDPNKEGRNHWGRELVGAGGLGCIVCHNLRGQRSLGIPAIDLATAPQRLRREWFGEFLVDPQKFRPGTRMPSFWPGGKAINTSVSGGAPRQIDSIWTYLVEIEQSRLPVGMEREGNFELKPTDKPIVFRTFMQDAGTHAIAVGFPRQVHAAFDAKQVRWALAWRGRFLDAESTWDDRVTPPARPLGEDLLRLPPHMPLARLPAADAPWPDEVGEAAGYEFRGYRLDDAGAPTMLYEFDGVMVEDTARPGEDGRSLVRTMVLRGEAADLFFRGITSAKPQAAVFRAGVATVTEVLTW